ncbi:unnamed protein product [marine sediment metagenome]|uniref:Gas vesicle synthesis protein GvpO n=1 Tax=marine sediment metagenome TaxID=412755 RepID=X1NBN6_9ZZZZ
MVDIKELGEKAKKAVESSVGRKALNVIGASNEKGKWKITVQVLERKAVPDSQDLIGIYEVTLSDAGKVLGFKRTSTRHRGIPYGTEERKEEE